MILPIGQMMNAMNQPQRKPLFTVTQESQDRIKELYGETHTYEPRPFDNKFGRVNLEGLMPGESVVAGGKGYYWLLKKKP